MTRQTKDKFSRTCYGIPKQKRGHVPEIEERGTRMALRCSCGYRKPVGTWGNQSGWAYAVVSVYHKYQRHVRDAA